MKIDFITSVRPILEERIKEIVTVVREEKSLHKKS